MQSSPWRVSYFQIVFRPGRPHNILLCEIKWLTRLLRRVPGIDNNSRFK